MSYKFLARPDLHVLDCQFDFIGSLEPVALYVGNGFSLFWCVFCLRLWRYSDTRGSGFGIEIRFSEFFELFGV